MSVLEQVLERIDAAAREDRLPVLVFDLDSTLIDTRPRHLAILRAYAASRGGPAVQAVAEQAVAEDFRWFVHGPLTAAGLTVPADLHGFWMERYFHGDWLAHDAARPGAVTFCREAWRRGAMVVYLTGRPAPTMGAGTLRQLADLDLPLWDGRASLHLKPASGIDDGMHKRTAVRRIRELQGRVVATFENEPQHANTYVGAFPDAVHILVGDLHTPGAPEANAAVRRIEDFHR